MLVERPLFSLPPHRVPFAATKRRSGATLRLWWRRLAIALTTILAIALSCPAPARAIAPVSPDGSADTSAAQTHWVVVYNNPRGLPCRRSSAPPLEVFSDPERPNAIYNWSVERKLTWGQRFYTLPNGGDEAFYDDRGNPWLFVRFNRDPDRPQGCFVRDSRRTVEPI